MVSAPRRATIATPNPITMAETRRPACVNASPNTCVGGLDGVRTPAPVDEVARGETIVDAAAGAGASTAKSGSASIDTVTVPADTVAGTAFAVDGPVNWMTWLPTPRPVPVIVIVNGCTKVPVNLCPLVSLTPMPIAATTR